MERLELKKVVVGINNTYFHDIGDYSSDGNISIMINGKIVMSISEERVSRKKYDGDFRRSLSYALSKLNLLKDSVDEVVMVGFAQYVNEKIEDSVLVKQVYEYFERTIPITFLSSHHEGHAWTAIAQSGLQNCLIAVLDHSGSILEYGDNQRLDNSSVEQTSYYLWDGDRLRLIARDHDGNGALGYGRLYSKVTRYIGFGSYHESGKTMGMASLGARYSFEQKEEAFLCDKGEEKSVITHSYYSDDGLTDLTVWANDNLSKKISGPYDISNIREEQIYLAKWVQYSLEQSVLRKIKSLLKEYNVETICITGGVALNSVLNSRIERETGKKVFVPSAPGDTGLSYGALAYYFYLKTGQAPFFGESPFGGPLYSEEEIVSVLENTEHICFKKSIHIEEDAAKLLHEGNIIAWFQGKSEFGPRALGNRSILASARNPWTKEILNGMVKRREWFRPFAPSVVKEKVYEYFNVKNTDFDYMMKVSDIKEFAKAVIPSAIHFDDSARLQTVSKNLNHKYYTLLKKFEELGNPPVLLNTSFNLNNMPLVETPNDAVECFLKGDFIDCLVIGDYIVSKNS